VGGERPEPVTPPHSPAGGAHANVHLKFEGMCAAKTERVNPHQQPDKLLAPGQEVRSTRRVWVPPVGGALSRHTSTWEVHATGVHRRGRVVPRSKQPRRCQAAEETRGPPSGRAYRRGVNRTPLGAGVLRWHFGGLRVRELCLNQLAKVEPAQPFSERKQTLALTS
jgi:hypothetical protein